MQNNAVPSDQKGVERLDFSGFDAARPGMNPARSDRGPKFALRVSSGRRLVSNFHANLPEGV
jgi:hypothetical protein